MRRSEDRAREQDATLRIRLVLSDCPELADIPWEFLYDQENGSFVALSEATPVVRYLQLPKQPRPLRVALPLRVLAIRSEPADSQPLDLETEWSQVMASLRKFTNDGAIIVTDLVQPTVKDLLRVLRHEHFHVLHYMGHGKFSDQDGGVLLFADEAGRGTPVSGEKLGVILGDHPSLRLAVLNACEAGRTDPVDPFGGIADTLVRRGIPAVIAMQFEISDAAAIEFAPALYGALAAGRPVDAAVAEARKAIYTAVSPLEWATPVLHLRADNAHLFDIDQAGPSFWGRARSFANRPAPVTAVIALLVAALAVTFPVVLPLVLNPHRPVPRPSASRSTAEPYCPSGTLAPLTVFGSAAFGPIAQGAYSAYKKLCPRAEINFQYDQGQSSAFSVDTLNNDVKEHKQVGSMIAMYDGPTTDGSLLIRHPVGVVIYSVIAHTHLYPTSIISTNTLQSLFAPTSSDVPDEVAVGLQGGSGTRQALLWLFHEAADSVSVTKSGCPPRAGDWECTESSYVATFNFVSTTRDAIGYVAIYGKVNGQPASYPITAAPLLAIRTFPCSASTVSPRPPATCKAGHTPSRPGRTCTPHRTCRRWRAASSHSCSTTSRSTRRRITSRAQRRRRAWLPSRIAWCPSASRRQADGSRGRSARKPIRWTGRATGPRRRAGHGPAPAAQPGSPGLRGPVRGRHPLSGAVPAPARDARRVNRVRNRHRSALALD